MQKYQRFLIISLLFALILAACTPPPLTTPPPRPSPSPHPPTATPTPPPPNRVWIGDSVPDALWNEVAGWGLPLTNSRELGGLHLEISESPAETNWVYALVAPFPTIRDGIKGEELRALWQEDSEIKLLMAESTKKAFIVNWGEPSSKQVRTAKSDELLDLAWGAKNLWAIIPFEEIEPRWKVLSIDGQSPMHNDFVPENYPLKNSFSLTCGSPCPATLPLSNRDPEKLTVLMMTGVTALVRATAYKMEVEGLLYPARDIGDWLRDADITHISNEIPFASYCPYPNPNPDTQSFCSNPRYIELLEYIGMDVVELTGNHFKDQGSEATLYTLEMYNERGIPYYGGGKNLEDAHKPITLEHNGNKFVFIGCNPVGPDYAWARDDGPGAAPCDFDYMTKEIRELRAVGYLPIATFQHQEYYSPEIRPQQGYDFRLMADAGAVIVSGSQAHFSQAKEFYNGVFIDYGLGNLFFDQMHTADGTRNEFLDRHTFYGGRYLGVELLTALLEDYARPRPMTPAERTEFLTYIFDASGWGEMVATLTPTPTTTPRPVD